MHSMANSLLNYKHHSFDLDGTLIDSLVVMEKSWKAVSDEFGLGQTFQDYRQYIGLPFKQIMKNLGINDRSGRIEHAYFLFSRGLASEIKVIEGARCFLNRLHEFGLVTSVITSKSQLNAEELIKALGLRVDVIVGADGHQPGKPSPQILDKCLSLVSSKNMSVTAEDTVYYGDTLIDFCFALNSGVSYRHCIFGLDGHLYRNLHPQPEEISGWKHLSRVIFDK